MEQDHTGLRRNEAIDLKAYLEYAVSADALSPRNQGRLSTAQWLQCCEVIRRSKAKVPLLCAITILRRKLLGADAKAYAAALSWSDGASAATAPSRDDCAAIDPVRPTLAGLPTDSESQRAKVLATCLLSDLLISVMRAPSEKREQENRRLIAVAREVTGPTFLGSPADPVGQPAPGTAPWVVQVFGAVASLVAALPRVPVPDSIRVIKELGHGIKVPSDPVAAIRDI